MQTCPNCGASNAAGAKFCTTCGKPLKVQTATNSQAGESSQANAQSQATQPQDDPAMRAEMERQKQIQAQIRAEQVAQFKQSSRGYWNYLVDSWKKPSEIATAKFNKWFGVISMAAWALMGSIAVGRGTQNGINTATNFANSIVGGLTGDSSADDSVNSAVQSNAMIIYFKFFILLLVGMLAFGLVGFLFRKWAQKEEITYLDYITDLMHRCNLNIILVFCVMILSLMGGLIQFLSVIAVSLGASIFMIGFMQSIIVPKPRVGFDSVYLTVVAMIALELVLIILITIFGQSLISQFSSMF